MRTALKNENSRTAAARAAAALAASLMVAGRLACPSEAAVQTAGTGTAGTGAAGSNGSGTAGTNAPGGTAAPIGAPSGSTTSPQTPGTGTAPGTSAGAAPGNTAAPVAAQAPGAAVGQNGATGSASAVSSFGAGSDTGAAGNNAAGSSSMGSGGSVPVTNGAPDNPNFDLTRTIRAAQTSSAQLLEAQRNVQIDQKRADEAESQERPNITGTGSATRFDAATRVSLGGQSFQVIGDHTEAVSLALNQRIDLLGDVRATRSQIKLQEAADRFDLDRITNARVLQANTGYFDLLRAIHQVSVAEATLRNAQAQQSVANKLYLGQIGQKIDFLRANTDVAEAQQSLTAAQNQRDVALEAFNDLVGRPLTSPVTLLDTPGVTVGIDLPSASASAAVGSETAAVRPEAFAPPNSEVDAIDVGKSVDTALTLRPEILQNTVRVRSAETGIRIARFGQEPTFAVSASGNYYPTPSFQTPRQKTAALTAVITIPFYDGGATRSRIAEAKLERDNAQTALESAKSDVSLQVRQAYLNLRTAARQIASANSALDQAIAARQLAQVRYEGQVGLYLEVTDAQAALVRSENSQVDAVYNYLIARAQFENAVGLPSAALGGGSTSGGTISAAISTTSPGATPPRAAPTEAPLPTTK